MIHHNDDDDDDIHDTLTYQEYNRHLPCIENGYRNYTSS